ncbi:hypothetical protein R1sor_025714 [Riccia sorocarpa]|uniref:Uncharacterized protein n=1 Tax=Riccia sorocarpa TaxID=122646 RepID=A0ABD3GAW8_9MARC
MSTSSVGGFAVGEENAGIVVLRLMETVDPMVISQELPNFSSDEPHLCRWPICSLRVEENGKILGDLYSAYADADFARDAVPRRRKRAYFSTKRKLRTEEEKCCQTWRLEEVKELRREIYGVKFDKKLDLIYQKINASQGRQDGMVLCYNGRFVCPKAFWQFHGISKSSYYKYKEESNKGAKQGYHGNTGTFKPRESTIQAEAILKKMLLEMSEPMPHLNFDNSNGQGTDSFYHRLLLAMINKTSTSSIALGWKMSELRSCQGANTTTCGPKNLQTLTSTRRVLLHDAHSVRSSRYG